MRPLRLTIQGLNSFIDTQIIDFQALSIQGLFGIFGPTGSGKSTILDGMLLALYGRKAVSRGTGEFVNKNCKTAKLSYEFQVRTANVRKYRVEREFKGGEQEGRALKCRLLDITGEEKVLEESVTGVNRACAELIGLSAEDFMRTVVLPQGKFSEFLRAGGEERRRMLERLFGLERYGKELDEKIAGALNNKKEKCQFLQGNLEAQGDITEEELERREEEKDILEKELWDTKKEEERAKAEYWECEEVFSLQVEKEKWMEKEKSLSQKEEQIEKKKNQVKNGKRAEGLLPLLFGYQQLEREKEEIDLEIEKMEQKRTLLYSKKEEEKDNYIQQKEQKEREEPRLKAQIQEIEEWKKEWERLPVLKKEEKLLERERRKGEEKKEELKKRGEQLYRNKKVLFERKEKMEQERRERTIGKDFREKVEEGIKLSTFLQSLEKDLCEKRKEKEKIQREIEEVQREKKEEEEKEERWRRKQEELLRKEGELEEDIRNIQIHRLRRELKQGSPCPVCGSVHYKKNNEENIQEIDWSEAEKEGKKVKASLLKNSEEGKEIFARKAALSEKETLLEHQKKQWQDGIEGKEEERKKEGAILLNIQKEGGIEDFFKEKKRIEEFERRKEELEFILLKEREEEKQLEEEIEGIRKELEKVEKELFEIEVKLIPLKERIKEKEEKIGEKLKGKNPYELEKDVVEKLTFVRKEWEEAEKKREQSKIEWEEAEERFHKKIGEREGNKNTLQKAEKQLVEEMRQKEFSTINEIEEALLQREQFLFFEKEIKDFEDRRKEAKAFINSLEEKLQGRKAEEEEREEKRKRYKEIKEKRECLREKWGEVKEKIHVGKEKLEMQKKCKEELKKVRRQASILEELRSVTRGKKFVEYMAVERLRLISKRASSRLMEISQGNYEIQTNSKGEFVIQDNKNGGTKRHPSTLSGGETFITSLALALALSEEIQSRGTVPLELFFLDEGFGALDEELLDLVMDSLERIRHSRLTIGMISHVEAVKARVPVHLFVEPAGTGRGSKVKMEYL